MGEREEGEKERARGDREGEREREGERAASCSVDPLAPSAKPTRLKKR